MLQVTTTEFKNNLSKYLTLVNKDDIIITHNGVPIAQISPPKKSLSSQLIGIIPDDDYTIDDARKERLQINENCT